MAVFPVPNASRKLIFKDIESKETGIIKHFPKECKDQ
jgi:hypothetical protein